MSDATSKMGQLFSRITLESGATPMEVEWVTKEVTRLLRCSAALVTSTWTLSAETRTASGSIVKNSFTTVLSPGLDISEEDY